MIDFLHKKNVNAEGAILEPEVIHKILIILENGSMNEAVRMNLSEKKKIKDLFLVVIRSIDINKNRALVASLVQFVANLCYGTNKFRKMLLTAENTPADFIQTLSSILSSVKDPEVQARQAGESKEEPKNPEM